MIGFNGTYLKAATHHGMRITAACLGGQWVLGKWLMTATAQAILAAFGAEEGMVVISKTNDCLNGIAATDTARAQQLADFIQEDPLLVCSLVETSKVRSLNNLAKGAYFKLPNDYPIDKHIEQMWYLPSATSQSSSCGIFGQSSTFSLHPWWYSATQVRGQFNKSEFGINPIITDDYTRFVVPSNESRCITYNSSNIEVNNTIKGIRVPITSPHLFAVNGGGATLANTGFVHLIVNNEDGTPFEHWLPILRNGNGCIFDTVNGILLMPTSGQFTIQLTDKP